jgi:hypothetical protein
MPSSLNLGYEYADLTRLALHNAPAAGVGPYLLSTGSGIRYPSVSAEAWNDMAGDEATQVPQTNSVNPWYVEFQPRPEPELGRTILRRTVNVVTARASDGPAKNDEEIDVRYGLRVTTNPEVEVCDTFAFCDEAAHLHL